MSKQNQISVVSEPAPQNGQKHRSSNHFSTKSLDDGSALTWTCPDGVVFDVKQDKTLATDPTVFSGLTNGSTTELVHKSDLYIANPKNADGSFTVTATVVS